MATFRHRASRLRPSRRSPAFIPLPPPTPDAWRHFAAPAGRERTALGRLQQNFTAPGTGSGRPPAAWRPLIRFWLVLLAVGAAFAGTLEYLGPPARGSAQEPEPPGGRGEVVEAERATSAALPPGSGSGGQAPSGALLAPQGTQTAGEIGQSAVSPAPATARRLTVFHTAGSATAAAAVQRLTAQAGLTADAVGAEPAVISSPRANIRFYTVDDHPLARRIGRELGQMGYSWQIENLSAQAAPSEPRGVEVWLPFR